MQPLDRKYNYIVNYFRLYGIYLIGTYKRHLLLSNQLLATVASAASRHSYATPTVFQARHTHTTLTWRLGRPLPHEEGATTVAEDEKVSGQLDDA